jgi:hypothetical protein
MNRKFIRLFAVVPAFAVGIFAVLGCSYYLESQRVKVEASAAPRVAIYFTVIDRTAELSGLQDLRKIKLDNDDIEVRVWRGFGLSNLEGVVLKRSSGEWSAVHIEADDYAQPEHVKITDPGPPKSGWDAFWKRVTEQGLLTIRDPTGSSCDKVIGDSDGYVVEVNRNRSYRAYRYNSGACPDVERMKEIGNIIGEEFGSDQEQCRRAEWFGCTKERRKNNLF